MNQYPHWREVKGLLDTGVLTVSDDLGLIERNGLSHAETSYLTAKYRAHTVATPSLIDTMAKEVGPSCVQIYMNTPMWATALASRGVDMIAVGHDAVARTAPNLVITRGDGHQVTCYPHRTLLLIDVPTLTRIAATFGRFTGQRIVYLGRPIKAEQTGNGWHLDKMHPTYGHQTGSELRVYERN